MIQNNNIAKSTTNFKINSVKEIILTFSDIDDKITALNECSSQDFKVLNKHLKAYYTKAKKITDNSNEILEIVIGDNNKTFFSEILSFEAELKKNIVLFEKQINHSIKTLEKILINLNLMFVPLNNFNQNLMTLRFLFTNLKFSVAYFDTESSQKINSQTGYIDELINNIRTAYPLISNNLYQLKAAIGDTLRHLKDIKKRNAANAEHIFQQINISSSFLIQRNEDAKRLAPLLKERTDNCFNSVSEIVTKLQFQDIVQQKMEHIQNAHREIIKELKFLDDSLHVQEDSEEKKQHCFAKIRDISGLQVAQLIYSNKEFQDAIGIIISKFIEIGDDMSGLAEISIDFSELSQKSGEAHFYEIEENLKNAGLLITDFSEVNQEYILEVDTIHISIEKIASNFDNIFDLENKLEELASNTINISSDTALKEKEMHLISNQIKTLFADAYTITNNMKELFRQTLNLSLGLLCDITGRTNEIKVENIEKNLIEITRKTEILLNEIVSRNSRVHNILEENSVIAGNISGDIRDSIEEVKYYNFFENVIEEIISQLNSIHNSLQDRVSEACAISKKENLRQIEKLYTVKTERLIHNNIVENNKSEFEDNSNEANDEGWELF